MNELQNTQEEFLQFAEEVVSTLRSGKEAETVIAIKEVQDSIRAQYDKTQFEAKDLLKSTRAQYNFEPPAIPLLTLCLTLYLLQFYLN